ncbi:MAG TPA: glyoxalase [Chryseobacterium sp.]|nr:glyoxalase [Chryseobacterium sp.]
MNISSFATCLNVKDVKASSEFFIRHFGFAELMSADGFASLRNIKNNITLIFHEIGLEVLPDDFKQNSTEGVILAFIVTDIEAEEKRLKDQRVVITTPLRTESWGEKLFLLKDPNGILIEVAEWNRSSDQ